jgi:hypothetical protein
MADHNLAQLVSSHRPMTQLANPAAVSITNAPKLNTLASLHQLLVQTR